MVANLLEELSDSLKADNPFFLEGYINTRKVDDKVMAADKRERSYKGIDDRKGNYFYVRYNDEYELLYTESEVQYTSCSDTYDVSVPLRLVCVTRGLDQFKLERKLRNDLLRVAWVGDDYQSNICIVLKSSIVEPTKVYKDETGKEEMKGSIDLFAIDFELKYTYSNTNCLTVQDLCDDLLC